MEAPASRGTGGCQASVRHPHGSSHTLSGRPALALTGPEQQPPATPRAQCKPTGACPASLLAGPGLPLVPQYPGQLFSLSGLLGKGRLALEAPFPLSSVTRVCPSHSGCFLCCSEPGVNRVANSCQYDADSDDLRCKWFVSAAHAQQDLFRRQSHTPDGAILLKSDPKVHTPLLRKLI